MPNLLTVHPLDSFSPGQGLPTINSKVATTVTSGQEAQIRVIAAASNVVIVTSTVGTTSTRPTTGLYIGQEYYDPAIRKPVYWDGGTWRDAMGNVA